MYPFVRICFSNFRSAKYQASLLETSASPFNKNKETEAPQQSSDQLADVGEPIPDSASQQKEDCDEGEEKAAVETEVQTVIDTNAEIIEEASAIQFVKVTEMVKSPHEEQKVPLAQQTAAGTEYALEGSTVSNLEPVLSKPKKDKMARLRELGLVPPPVAKLSAHDGAFVQLEPSHANPGEKVFY